MRGERTESCPVQCHPPRSLELLPPRYFSVGSRATFLQLPLDEVPGVLPGARPQLSSTGSWFDSVCEGGGAVSLSATGSCTGLADHPTEAWPAVLSCLLGEPRPGPAASKGAWRGDAGCQVLLSYPEACCFAERALRWGGTCSRSPAVWGEKEDPLRPSERRRYPVNAYVLFDFCNTNKKNLSSQAPPFPALVPALSFQKRQEQRLGTSRAGGGGRGRRPEEEEAAAQPPQDKASPTSLQRKSARLPTPPSSFEGSSSSGSLKWKFEFLDLL